MDFESQITSRSVLKPEREESEEEVRKRAEAQREGRRELALKWRDLPCDSKV